MSKTEIPEDIAELARKVGKQFKSEQDLADFSRLLKKMAVEAALGAEIDEHLGYDKHDPKGRGSGNSRNGYSSKTLKGDHGEVEIDTPRDRSGTFESQLVRKGQTRLTQFDDQILSLYAKGMSTRDIVATFKEMYDADVSATLISRVTDAVLDQVLEWQSRPLDDLYPIVYLDWHRAQDSPGQARDQQGYLCGPWGSIWRARRSCWGCGWPRPRAPSSGCRC